MAQGVRLVSLIEGLCSVYRAACPTEGGSDHHSGFLASRAIAAAWRWTLWPNGEAYSSNAGPRSMLVTTVTNNSPTVDPKPGRLVWLAGRRLLQLCARASLAIKQSRSKESRRRMLQSGRNSESVGFTHVCPFVRSFHRPSVCLSASRSVPRCPGWP